MSKGKNRRYSTHLSGRRRTNAGDRRLGIVLAFVAGAINAGGFLAVGAYTSHMSGFVSGVADNLILGQLGLAGAAVIYILSFFSGAVTSSLLINWARYRKLQSEFALAIMLEAVLLLLFGLLAANMVFNIYLGTETTIALLCYIMGLQNSVITKASHAVIRTTHMTGVITDIGVEVGRYIFGKTTGVHTRFRAGNFWLLTALLTAFLTGGIIGAFSFSRYGFVSVLPFAGVLALVGIGPVAEDFRRRIWPAKMDAPLETPDKNSQLDSHDPR
ncbi:MAG: YoaK family protein [Asticcacaulis sp.]